MIFVADFVTFIKRLLPPKYRKSKWLAWMQSLAKPVHQLYGAPSVTNPIRYPECIIIPVPSFLSFRNHALLRASLNGETIVLERLLNLYFYSFFDSTSPKGSFGYWIHIEDLSDELGYSYAYKYIENKPLFVHSKDDYTAPPPLPNNASSTAAGPQYIYSMVDYYSQVDFLVNIPSGISFADTEIKNLLNTYKVSAAKYVINYY